SPSAKIAALYRDELDYAKTASKYFRQLTVLTALHGQKQSRAADPLRDQRRSVSYVSWLPGDHTVCNRIRSASVARWQGAIRAAARKKEPSEPAHFVNLIAREFALEYIQRLVESDFSPADQPKWIRDAALEHLKALANGRNGNLVTASNYIRLGLVFGGE